MEFHTGAVALTTRLLLFCTLPHVEPHLSIKPTERHTESVSPTNPIDMHRSIPASTHTMTIDIGFTGEGCDDCLGAQRGNCGCHGHSGSPAGTACSTAAVHLHTAGSSADVTRCRRCYRGLSRRKGRSHFRVAVRSTRFRWLRM